MLQFRHLMQVINILFGIVKQKYYFSNLSHSMALVQNTMKENE